LLPVDDSGVKWLPLVRKRAGTLSPPASRCQYLSREPPGATGWKTGQPPVRTPTAWAHSRPCRLSPRIGRQDNPSSSLQPGWAAPTRASMAQKLLSVFCRAPDRSSRGGARLPSGVPLWPMTVSTAAPAISEPAAPVTQGTSAVTDAGEGQRPDPRLLELSTLYEISKILGSSLDLEQSLTGILRILNSFMEMRKGTILLYDARTGELSIRLAHGMTPEEMARGRYQVGEGILGKVMRHGLPMV